MQLLSSQKRYAESKLKNLNQEQTWKLKTAFTAYKHPRFKKEAANSRHNPYGKTFHYIIHVQTADKPKISKLIKILAMLSQTKVYLIWKKQST